MSDEERLARQFHEVYERLAPSFGYATREETREFDPLSPNGLLMVAVCKELRDAEIERLIAECVVLRTQLLFVASESKKHNAEIKRLIREREEFRTENAALDAEVERLLAENAELMEREEE